MEIRPELRRDPPDRRPLPPSNPALVERMRAEIAADGPMTFARFMELALADPEHGYYATPGRPADPDRRLPHRSRAPPDLRRGRSPARSTSNGERSDRPARFLLREYGAGTGVLAESILRGLADDRSGLLDALAYEPVELLPARVERIRDRLAAAGFAAALAEQEDRATLDGAVLANEFLDALPVHRVVMRDGTLLERFVGWSAERDRFEDVGSRAVHAGPRRAPRRGRHRRSRDGQAAEIRLATDPWVAAMSAGIGRGFATVIDYGAPAAELYGPARHDGTLRAYSGQRAHADPYVAIGRQDLTAHVDFTAIERARRGPRLAHARPDQPGGVPRRSRVSASCSRPRGPARCDPEAYLALRASAARLLDPRALGGSASSSSVATCPRNERSGGAAYRVRG